GSHGGDGVDKEDLVHLELAAEFIVEILRRREQIRVHQVGTLDDPIRRNGPRERVRPIGCRAGSAGGPKVAFADQVVRRIKLIDRLVAYAVNDGSAAIKAIVDVARPVSLEGVDGGIIRSDCPGRRNSELVGTIRGYGTELARAGT